MKVIFAISTKRDAGECGFAGANVRRNA